MNLTIEEGNKVRLPDEFVKFWNLSVGDEVYIYRGKESVVLLAKENIPKKRRQYRGDLPLAEQLVEIIENSPKAMSLEQLILPDRLRSTIRGRLSELTRAGRIKKRWRKGISYWQKLNQ